VIASARLGPSLGLARLADGVQDHADNVTRYAVVGRPGGWRPTDRVPTKSTILFTVPDKSGALHRALSAFALRDVDLTKLESRPIPGRPWEYVFYADLASSADDIRCQRAIANLSEFAPMVRVLGSYAAYRAPVAAAGARSAQAVAPGFEWALPDARES